MSNQKKKWLIAGIVILVLLLIGLLLFVLLGGEKTPVKTEDPVSTGDAVSTIPTGEKTDPTVPDTDPTTAQTDPTTIQTDPTKPTTPKPTEPKPTEPKEEEPDDTVPPPTDPPPSVVIPGDEDGLNFPFTVPGHDLVIEKLAPYTGMYVEDGSNAQCKDVAMLLIRNKGKKPVEYTRIAVKFKSETLEFHLSALPVGEGVVVQEHSGKAVPAGKALEAAVLAVQRAEMTIAPELSVKDNGDNSITVENLTDKTIPTARVFYKYYMENEKLYVGGIAFTVKVTNLPAKGKVVIRPSHFVSETSRVVMAQTYDS